MGYPYQTAPQQLREHHGLELEKNVKSLRMGKSGEMLSSAHDVAIAHMKPCCMNHCSLPLQDLHKTKPVKSSSIGRGGVPELFKVNGC